MADMKNEMGANQVVKEPKFETYAIVEVNGHVRVAGLVSEATIAGYGFIRVDVPSVGPQNQAYTRYFGPSAIYSILPCTEDTAREAALKLAVKPNEFSVSR